MDKRKLIKYLSAFTMGDGGVYYSGNHCRFVCNQVKDNEDYIKWRADILSSLTTVNLHESTQEGKKTIISTTTKTHPTYTKIRKRLYIDNYKSVDPFYLKSLDWEMMSILFQDDGSMSIESRVKNPYPTFRLNTKRLSYGDSVLLKKAIKEKLDVEFNVQRHYDRWFLALRAKDSEKFNNSIKPFIFPSFKYKIV